MLIITIRIKGFMLFGILTVYHVKVLNGRSEIWYILPYIIWLHTLPVCQWLVGGQVGDGPLSRHSSIATIECYIASYMGGQEK